MRKSMKDSGFTAVIIASLAAMAFMPRNVAGWVVLAVIIIFAVSKVITYYSEHKDVFSNKKEKIRSRIAGESAAESDGLFDLLIMQLSYRITDKLHSAFPEASWHWVDRPTVKLFTDGGMARISTNRTNEFTQADVILDSYGRIELKMLSCDTITKIVKATDENAETNYTVDADIWYSQCGQKVLTDVITNLNACGTKTLSIKEDGSMVIDDGRQVGTLKAFPGKNLWKKVVGIFEDNGLMAVENENCIELGW